MALGAGVSTHSVYNELIKLNHEGKISFENVVVFNISEFFPLIENGPCTLKRLKEVFLDQIDIKPENVHYIDTAVTKENMYEYCKA